MGKWHEITLNGYGFYNKYYYLKREAFTQYLHESG